MKHPPAMAGFFVTNSCILFPFANYLFNLTVQLFYMNPIIKTGRLAIFLFLFFTQACKVAWVPDYSAAIEDQIIATAQKNDRLYLDMLDVSAPNQYTFYVDRYNEIEAEINSIQLKNEARTNNTDMLKIIKNLKDAFQTYRTEHREKKTLKRGEVLVYQQTIKGFWTPLLIAEHGLKLAK